MSLNKIKWDLMPNNLKSCPDKEVPKARKEMPIHSWWSFQDLMKEWKKHKHHWVAQLETEE